MSDGEREWLYKQATLMQSVVEVGCWKGRTTVALAMGCPGTVYAVDHWLGSEAERNTAHREAVEGDVYGQFLANIRSYPNVQPIRMASVKAAADFEQASMVFIDAGHEYEEVRADIEAWRLKATRLICGHDYPFPGVKRAVDEAFGKAVRNPVARIWAVEL
jgi:dienelactone hydrolase